MKKINVELVVLGLYCLVMAAALVCGFTYILG